jgi:membrane protein YdbS with pleckstrin-like domain
VGSKVVITIVWLACGAGILAWERMMIRVSQRAEQVASTKFRTEFTFIVLSVIGLLILGVWFEPWALWLAAAVFAIGVSTITIRGLRRSIAERKS